MPAAYTSVITTIAAGMETTTPTANSAKLFIAIAVDEQGDAPEREN